MVKFSGNKPNDSHETIGLQRFPRRRYFWYDSLERGRTPPRFVNFLSFHYSFFSKNF
jgi:hypothetical protein